MPALLSCWLIALGYGATRAIQGRGLSVLVFAVLSGIALVRGSWPLLHTWRWLALLALAGSTMLGVAAASADTNPFDANQRVAAWTEPAGWILQAAGLVGLAILALTGCRRRKPA
jgi:hypothetical protein